MRGTYAARALAEIVHGSDPDMPAGITPLSWLRSMLAACETPAARRILGDPDPEAWDEMCAEVRALVSALGAIPRPAGFRDP